MKKLIVLLALVVITTDCKKKEVTPVDPTPTTEAYCIYQEMPQNKKKLLECVATQDEMIKKSVEYRNAGISVSSVKKSTCSDC